MGYNKILIITFLFVLNYYNSLSKTLIISCDSIDYTVPILEYLNISKEKAKEIDTIQLLKYDYNALPISAVDFPNLKELRIKYYDIYDLKGISDFKNLTSLVIERHYHSYGSFIEISEIFNIKSLKNLELQFSPDINLKNNTFESIETFIIKNDGTIPIYNLLYSQKKNKTTVTIGFDGDDISINNLPSYVDYLLCQKASIIETKPIDSLPKKIQLLKEQFDKTAIPKTGFYELKTDSIHIKGYFKNGLMDSTWNYVYKISDRSEEKSIYQYKNGNCIYHKDSMMCFVRLHYFNNNTYYNINKDYECKYNNNDRLEIDTISPVTYKIIAYQYNKEKDILLYQDLENYFTSGKSEINNDYKWVIDFKNHIYYNMNYNKCLLFFLYGSFIGCDKQLNECFTNKYHNDRVYSSLYLFEHNSYVIEESELCNECLNRYDELRKANYEDEFKKMIESIKF